MPEEAGGDRACPAAAEKVRGREFWKAIGSPKHIVAPMVDQSELAYRVLCRRYGADLCYTPMIHSRLFSEEAGYRKKEIAANFAASGAPPEEGPLFVQFCGNDPATLLAAAKLLPKGRFDAVDLNCGCPQGIARKGHYGAFLLSEKDLLVNIVRTLDQGLEVPVTVKIRLVSAQEDLQDTMALVSALEAAGASALTLHGRTKEMKGQLTRDCNWDAIAAVRQRVGIPLVANGGIETYADVERCLAHTGCDGVMSSEAVLESPSLFAPAAGKAAVLQDELALEYLDLARTYGTGMKYIKAHMFKFLYAGLQQHTDLRSQMGQAKSIDEATVVGEALRARRTEARAAASEVTGESWPDTGWYLRYRRPLGGKDKKRKDCSPEPAPASKQLRTSAEPVAVA